MNDLVSPAPDDLEGLARNTAVTSSMKQVPVGRMGQLIMAGRQVDRVLGVVVAVGLVDCIPETAYRSVGGGGHDLEDRRGQAFLEEFRDRPHRRATASWDTCLAISFLRSSGHAPRCRDQRAHSKTEARRDAAVRCGQPRAPRMQSTGFATSTSSPRRCSARPAGPSAPHRVVEPYTRRHRRRPGRTRFFQDSSRSGPKVPADRARETNGRDLCAFLVRGYASQKLLRCRRTDAPT